MIFLVYYAVVFFLILLVGALYERRYQRTRRVGEKDVFYTDPTTLLLVAVVWPFSVFALIVIFAPEFYDKFIEPSINKIWAKITGAPFTGGAAFSLEDE